MAHDKTQSPRRSLPVVYNLVLLVVALVVVFAVTEVVLRLVYYPENLGTVIRFDAALGWSLEPGAYMHSRDSERGLDYEININSLGLREREIPLRKPEGTRRVLVLGDSFVFGAGVEARWRTTDIMNRALGDDVEVINAGVSGWGTDQELIHYETVLRPLDADVVVLCMMVANDVINNMLDHLFLSNGTSKPRFFLENGELVWSGPVEKPAPRRFDLRRTLRKSHLLVEVKRRLDIALARPEEDRGVAAASGIEQEWMRRGYSHWLAYERHYRSDLEEGWQLTEAILERLAQDCDEDGAELIVMAFPLKIEVQDEWRERLMSRAGVDEGNVDLAQPYERLAGFCRVSGIEFVYPLDQFREGAESRDLYFRLDGHPNRYGHVLAARVLLDQLDDLHGYRFAIPPVDQPHFAALR